MFGLLGTEAAIHHAGQESLPLSLAGLVKQLS